MRPGAKTGLRDKLRELAQHPGGVHSSHVELAQWSAAKVGTQARALVVRAELFGAKTSRREARYFSTAADRDAFVLARARQKGWNKKIVSAAVARAPWPADAPMHLPPGYLFTRCPSAAPRFQEHVLSFVHGGLRCA